MFIFIGQALSSPETPHQVLKIETSKTTNLNSDDKYTQRLFRFTLTFMLHADFPHRDIRYAFRIYGIIWEFTGFTGIFGNFSQHGDKTFFIVFPNNPVKIF